MVGRHSPRPAPRRIVALVGPRQCGKTTLAREIVSAASPNYFDLKNPAGLARLGEPLTVLSGLRGTFPVQEHSTPRCADPQLDSPPIHNPTTHFKTVLYLWMESPQSGASLAHGRKLFALARLPPFALSPSTAYPQLLHRAKLHRPSGRGPNARPQVQFAAKGPAGVAPRGGPTAGGY